jgi:hypothetical protein
MSVDVTGLNRTSVWEYMVAYSEMVARDLFPGCENRHYRGEPPGARVCLDAAEAIALAEALETEVKSGKMATLLMAELEDTVQPWARALRESGGIAIFGPDFVVALGAPPSPPKLKLVSSNGDLR